MPFNLIKKIFSTDYGAGERNICNTKSGDLKGYFAWSCKTDGTRNVAGPASDGELYYVTSLIFASNRWGNKGELNYLAEAQNILNCSMEKKDIDFALIGDALRFGWDGAGFSSLSLQKPSQNQTFILHESLHSTFRLMGIGFGETLDCYYHYPFWEGCDAFSLVDLGRIYLAYGFLYAEMGEDHLSKNMV